MQFVRAGAAHRLLPLAVVGPRARNVTQAEHDLGDDDRPIYSKSLSQRRTARRGRAFQ